VIRNIHVLVLLPLRVAEHLQGEVAEEGEDLDSISIAITEM